MTLAELLAPFGVGGEDYLVELSRALNEGPIIGSAELSASEQSFLDRFGGVLRLPPRDEDGRAHALAVGEDRAYGWRRRPPWQRMN